MLIVTGTPRSGTSMWMQILVAAGFEAIGEPFSGDWSALLSVANPDGFWESQLIGGVYYRTNPHPFTGSFLFPEQTRFHVVKIMIPGLVRSDLAYIDRVIATVRDWREFVVSRERLRALQHEAAPGFEPHELAMRHELPAALEWWVDNFGLLRDIATRRYAAHVCSYQALLDDPEREIKAVIEWLGRGDAGKAMAAVKPERRTVRAVPAGLGEPVAELEPEIAEVFDELYDHVHRGKPLAAAFLTRLNETDTRLRPRLIAHETQARIAAAQTMLADLQRSE